LGIGLVREPVSPQLVSRAFVRAGLHAEVEDATGQGVLVQGRGCLRERIDRRARSAMKPVRWSAHALASLRDREVDRTEAERTLEAPERRLTSRGRREVLVRRYHDHTLR
jgi:hypothetical protein